MNTVSSVATRNEQNNYVVAVLNCVDSICLHVAI